MASARIDVQLSVADDVEAVAHVACLNDDLACRNRHQEQVGGDLFLLCDRKRCKQRHAIDELEFRSGCERSVDLVELAVGEKGEKRQNRADEYESRASS